MVNKPNTVGIALQDRYNRDVELTIRGLNQRVKILEDAEDDLEERIVALEESSVLVDERLVLLEDDLSTLETSWNAFYTVELPAYQTEIEDRLEALENP